MQNPPSAGLLGAVKEGMDVYDATGDKVGTVEVVRMGEEDPTNIEIEAVSGETNDYPGDDLLEEIASVLGAVEDIPEEIRARMVRYGFIRIDTGLLSPDQVALHTEIAGVSGDRVTLSVDQDDLYTL